jgi:lysozyme
MVKASEKCFELAHGFEGCELRAYQDSADIWTIGIGTTRYPDGKPVKKGDTCTLSQATMWFLWDMKDAETKLNRWLNDWNKKTLDQNKIDALVSFVYNVGYGETLMKMVNKNANDPAIWGAFLLYDKVSANKDGIDNDKDGKVDEPDEKKKELGLMRRRNSEAHLYFKNEINLYEELLRK